MKKDPISQQSHPEDKTSAEHEVRLQKVKALREQHIEPWPAAKPIDVTCQQVIDEFEEGKEKEYEVAGRLITLRLHGKTAFGHIQDRSGKLQIYIKQDIIGEQKFDFLQHYLDIGDIIWVKGHAFKTKTGDITLKVDDISLLSKCLHPLPEKFHGLADIETKYRQRYLDLISNPESREKFRKRTKIIHTMRDYLDRHDFLEVETPILHAIAGGAAARPFVTYHNAFDTNFFLRIATELHLKRLVVGGFERVYEIGRIFRNEGVSTKHNPEFTSVEIYMAHQNYKYMMNFVEQMLKEIVQQVNGSLQIPYGDHTIDFEKPFKRTTIKDVVKEYGKLTDKDLTAKQIDITLKKHGVELENKQASVGEKIFALFEALVEPKLIQPTFVTDFPIEVSPLAKRDPDNPEIAARFELFIVGMEFANGFNELNDPLDQAERFKEQMKAREAGDQEAHEYDADYVLALEHGLPPTVGVGIGIDRLTMLLTNTTSIKDVILFPTLKKK